jgi:hypothetical protein
MAHFNEAIACVIDVCLGIEVDNSIDVAIFTISTSKVIIVNYSGRIYTRLKALQQMGMKKEKYGSSRQYLQS